MDKNKVSLDEECEYKDLCEEFYNGSKGFECLGYNNCEHYDAFFEGKCQAIESEGL